MKYCLMNVSNGKVTYITNSLVSLIEEINKHVKLYGSCELYTKMQYEGSDEWVDFK